MSDKKTININFDLFDLKKKNKSIKKQKEKPKPVIKPNTLKKQLLEKIKEHRIKEKNKEQQFIVSTNQNNNTEPVENNETTNNFENDFSNALNYFQSVKDKHKEKKKKNKTIKTNNNNNIISNEQIIIDENIANNPVEISLELPETFKENNNSINVNDIYAIKLNPPPPYSNLKNSNKPTYREWRSHTQKNRVVISETDEPVNKKESILKPSNNIQLQVNEKTPHIKIDKPVENSIISSRAEKLQKLKNMFSEKKDEKIQPKLNKKIENSKKYNKSKYKTRRHTKTLKRKYVCGKLKEGNLVKVLIKDNQTRKKINKEIGTLKKQNINDVKKYLRDHGFIKVGTTAPNDVLRTMYESCILTGDVSNKNGDILVHNYLNNIENTTENNK